MRSLRLDHGERRLARSLLVGLALACAVVFSGTTAEARRLALVVGNADYSEIAPLKNAVNDAEAIAESLFRLGFEVTLLTNANNADFRRTLDAFAKEAEGAESVMFYYSGHAFQLNGVNYLLPVDARLESREAIRSETWNLDNIISQLQDRNRQTLIFLDACRDDPLPAAVRGSGATSGGLARVQTGVGTFVAFATAPGAVTFDGADDDGHSPFTSALLEYIEDEGLSVSDLLIQVRNDVEVRTMRRQTPWDQSSLRSQFYFNPVVESRQGLTEANFEQLALLPQADRERFLNVMRASGFPASMIAEAESAIENALANMEVVGEGDLLLFGDEAQELDSDELATLGTAGDGGLFFDEDLIEPQPEPERLAAVGSGAAPAQRAEAARIDAARAAAGAAPRTEATSAARTEATATARTDQIRTEVGRAEAERAGAAVRPGTTADRVAPGALAAIIGPDGSSSVVAGGRTLPLLTAVSARRLADLSSEGVTRVRLEGSDVLPDTDERRALLARIDPRLLGDTVDDPPETAMTPRELAAAVQTELERLGCYRMRIDGDWGRGSRTALMSYFLAKQKVPDELEPSVALLAALNDERQVVCKAQVASTAAPRNVTRTAPRRETAPQATTTTPRRTTGTAPRAPAASNPETRRQLDRASRRMTF